MDLYVVSENHLSVLSEKESATQIAVACKNHSVEIDHVRCNFLASRVFGQSGENSLENAWGSIATLAQVIGADTIETVTPPVPLHNFGDSQDGNPDFPIYELPTRSSSRTWEEIWSTFVIAIKKYTELATKHDLRLALEARPRELLHNTDSFLRLTDAVQSNRLGAVLDISHTYLVRETPAVSIQKLNTKIFCVHLGDNDGLTVAHWPPGQGRINWMSVIKALSAISYSGTLCIDVSGIDVEQEVIEGKSYIERLLQKEGMPKV